MGNLTKKKYFLSYYFKTFEGLFGYGNIDVDEYVENLPTISDIRRWEKEIKEDKRQNMNVVNVCILNFEEIQ